MPNSTIHIIFAIIAWIILSVISSNFNFLVLILFLVANLIDLDHLFANPIYDFNRKSIGFHVFHKKWLIALYFLFCFLPTPYSYFFMGLSLHILLDYLEWKRPFSLVLHKPIGSKSLDRFLKRF